MEHNDKYSFLLRYVIIYDNKIFYSTEPNVKKHFYVRKFKLFAISGVFVPGKHFQPSHMFGSKARRLP
jgi:hypothetical protein